MSNPEQGEIARLPSPVVYFISAERPLPGTAEEHFGMGDMLGRRVEDVRQDWSDTIDKVTQIITSRLEDLPGGYRMDAIEVSLGFSAKGKLGFIAEAGVQSSIKVTFKRP